MAKNMIQFRDPDLSAWQSAVDETVAKAEAKGHALSVDGATPVTRPDQDDSMIAAGNAIASIVDQTAIAPEVRRKLTGSFGNSRTPWALVIRNGPPSSRLI